VGTLVNDRDALFANVLDQPAEDTARLVFADCLQEHGEEDFGQFLRDSVVASRFRDEELIDDPDYYAALAGITSFAKTGLPAAWVASLGFSHTPLAPRDWAWDNAGDRVTVRIGPSAGIFTRGLISEFETTLGEWYAVSALAITAWPIERVRVSDVPGLAFEIHRLPDGWRLTGRVRVQRRNVPLTGTVAPAAIVPGAVLVDDATDWSADQFFADRAALVDGITNECAAIVEDLKDAAGDRWPRPRRRR
jgi:uncharacterized protein (TIGR02996 family)